VLDVILLGLPGVCGSCPWLDSLIMDAPRQE